MKSLSQSHYIEWRDIVDDYFHSQDWIKYIKDGIPANTNKTLKLKSVKIAVAPKSAGGIQKIYLRGLRAPKNILTKVEKVNGRSSKGKLSALQRLFSTPKSNKRVDNIAALLSQQKSLQWRYVNRK